MDPINSQLFRMGGDTNSYWLSVSSSVFSLSTVTVARDGIAVDSQKNVYVIASAQTTSYLIKFNPVGTVLWSRSLSGTNTPVFRDVAVDSTDSVYVVGTNREVASDLLVVKYNSSGTVQWQRSLGNVGSGIRNNFARRVKIDSSNNLYIVGYSEYFSSNGGILLAKYDSSGTLLFHKVYNPGTTEVIGNDVCIDSSGNIYIAAFITTSALGYVLKCNSTGTVTWARSLSTYGQTWGIDVDTSGNVYVCGQTESGKDLTLNVSKITSSGAHTWTRNFSLSGSNVYSNRLIIDSDRVYIVGNILVSGISLTALFLSLDLDGNLIWQRTLSTSEPWDVDVIDNSLYVSLHTTADNLIAIKLPVDGSRTGTYGGYTYAVGTTTNTTTTPTLANVAFTDQTGLQAVTVNLTSASPTLTFNTTNI